MAGRICQPEIKENCDAYWHMAEIYDLIGCEISGTKVIKEFMKAVIQRAEKASVSVGSKVIGEIGAGIVILLGISNDDIEQNADKMVDKVLNLRIFNDDGGKMNLSCLEVSGEALVISQFTLYGDCRKGRRPSYDKAAPPEKAERLYEYFVSKLKAHRLKVQTGIFGAMMSVSLINDGPVTLIVET